ncbi:MAG: LPS export ABC transporter periplasmic protein LptC [Gemmatimonadaceae bacterium]|nr:LPS export ABC transporter periplasmic protein LptC [Gemmatimonadaceae bacterium]
MSVWSRTRYRRRGVLGSALTAVMVLGAARCPRKPAAVKPVVAKSSAIPDSADQVIFGLRTVLTDQSVAKGLLLSDTAYTYDDGSRLELRRVNVTFYTAQGLKDGVMTSRTGVYNSRLSRLEARGDVVVIRDDGKRLTSPQLVYDQQRNQIFTDSAFVLNEPERTFTGIGFESDPRMTNFRCLRACKIIAPVQIPVK